MPIASVFGAGGIASCLYVYDIGDDWQHEVTILESTEDKAFFVRRLIDVTERATKGVREREGLRAVPDGWRANRFDLAKARKGCDK